jgi:protein-S-isoprenylcysteine O-methyltransferase Ste14
MKFYTDTLQHCIEHYGLIFFIANMVVILCTTIIIFAIFIDFVRYHKPKENKKKVNSWVETGTMFFYFLIYYLLMNWEPGTIKLESKAGASLLLLSGILLVITGCYVNVMGRLFLKHNWANQVTIYHDHTLITDNVYKLVRHPLYASLIWMLTGGCLIYVNYISFLSVMFIFIPMMYYRARQEEKLLTLEFAEYSNYKRQTGMFFPKIIGYGKL